MTRPASAAPVAAVVAVALLALAACAASQVAAPAPGPSADCGSAVTGLIGCLSYITPANPQSKPPSDCCAAVNGALKSPATVTCLCNAFGKDYGFPINLTRAAGLPAACGGNPAAFSKCNLKLPGSAPTEAPSGSTTPATGSPSPTKSAAVTRSPISAAVVLAAVAAPLLSYYHL